MCNTNRVSINVDIAKGKANKIERAYLAYLKSIKNKAVRYVKLDDKHEGVNGFDHKTHAKAIAFTRKCSMKAVLMLVKYFKAVQHILDLIGLNDDFDNGDPIVITSKPADLCGELERTLLYSDLWSECLPNEDIKFSNAHGAIQYLMTAMSETDPVYDENWYDYNQLDRKITAIRAIDGGMDGSYTYIEKDMTMTEPIDVRVASNQDVYDWLGKAISNMEVMYKTDFGKGLVLD